MINRREQAICKKRGHDGPVYTGWTQCKWCNTWLREVRTLEEREDEPPEAELDVRVKFNRDLARARSGIGQARNTLESMKSPATPPPKPRRIK